MKQWSASDELAFDIAYALAQTSLRPKKVHLGIEACMEPAREVVAHLQLCGWLLDRKPPAAPIDTHPKPKPT